MFTITVRLNNMRKVGISALDFRRRHGLPDGPYVYSGPEDSQSISVDEDFARRYFPRQSLREEVWLNADRVTHLKIVDADNRCVTTCLPDSEVKSLYIWQQTPFWKKIVNWVVSGANLENH